MRIPLILIVIINENQKKMRPIKFTAEKNSVLTVDHEPPCCVSAVQILPGESGVCTHDNLDLQTAYR